MQPPIDPRHKCLLVGIAGSADTYSLSLYALKAFALTQKDVAQTWSMSVIQHGLISPLAEAAIVPQLIEEICRHQPDLVAFSCYCWNVKVLRQVAASVAERLPGSRFLWGGPEIATDYVQSGRFDDYAMDFCVIGEGEQTFVELLRRLFEPSPAFADIAGLCHRSSRRAAFTVNAAREPFRALTDLPSPTLMGVLDEEVLQRPGLEANLETQRGCSLRCSYCVYHKDMKRISYGSCERVLAEARFLEARGIHRLRFDDANFTSDIDFAKTLICGLIRQRTRMALMFELVPGFIDEEFCDLVAEYQELYPDNRVTVGVGVQSINHEILKRIRRGIRLETFERTFTLLQTRSIFTKIDLIVGLPGETPESIETTMEYMLKRLRHSREHLLCFHIMRELPGTELRSIGDKLKMEFSGEADGHELIQSPEIPRAELIRLLRLTAVIFRLTNHAGWSAREFLSGKSDDDTEVRELFFQACEAHGGRALSVVEALVEELKSFLAPRRSRFVQPEFPLAEAWWWNNARYEVPNRWLKETLLRLGQAGPAVQVSATKAADMAAI